MGNTVPVLDLQFIILRGSARPNRRILYNFILYLKWSSMFVETSVKISEKSDEKWRSYS